MRFSFYRYLFYLVVALPLTGYNQEMTGKVYDRETGFPVAFAHVWSAAERNLGTVTNELGAFGFSFHLPGDSISISHLYYADTTVAFSPSMSIALRPEVIVLPELVVNMPLPDMLVQRAYDTARVLASKLKYGKAFYRKLTYNDSLCNEFQEVFYDIMYTNAGIEGWQIQAARYALLTNEDLVHITNFSYLTGSFRCVQFDPADVILPLSPHHDQYYSYSLDEIIRKEKRRVAVISFKPAPSQKDGVLLAGALYIDMESYELHRFTGWVSGDDLGLEFPRKFHPREGRLAFDINFVRWPHKGMLLDYIRVEESFTLYRKRKKIHHVKSSSMFWVFERSEQPHHSYYEPVTRGVTDLLKLKEMPYDKRFWANHPVIRRTPLEKNIIQRFENENSFTNMIR